MKPWKYLIVALLVLAAIGVRVYIVFSQKDEVAKPVVQSGFDYNEVLTAAVGRQGVVLKNKDGSVVVTIPPLTKDTQISVSFKQSDYKVSSGVRAPMTIVISPDVDIMSLYAGDANTVKPITINAAFDAIYNLPVPYLINTNGRLSAANIDSLDNIAHRFVISTFHGGNYSWVYAN